MTMKNNSNTKCPLGEHLQHYWDRLSEKEQEMQFDEEGLFSLALQKIALEIAQNTPGSTVVDAFCGAGGSAIGFALSGKNVIAIDSDAGRLEMAKYNADIFGVSSLIKFIEGDCLKILPTLNPDSIFLDPPWGGTDYGNIGKFKLLNFEPDGSKLLDLCFGITDKIVIRLPKNFDLEELKQFNRKFDLQENILEAQLLHYCVYFR